MFAMRFQILATDLQGPRTSLGVGPTKLQQPSRCCGCLKHCKHQQSLHCNSKCASGNGSMGAVETVLPKEADQHKPKCYHYLKLPKPLLPPLALE